MPKVPRYLHLVNCFQKGMLKLDGPMGQCFSRFMTVSQRSREDGKKRKEGTGWTRRVIPNSHIPRLQVQLAHAWQNRLCKTVNCA